MQLQINPVFAEVIPELTLDEFAQLEENILAENSENVQWEQAQSTPERNSALMMIKGRKYR